MNYKEMLAKARNRAAELSKAAGERDLTDVEMTEVKSLTEEITDLTAKVKSADEGAALLKTLGAMGQKIADEQPETPAAPVAAKSLGEHWRVTSADRFKASRQEAGATVGSPEFKANTDNSTTGGYNGGLTTILSEIDRTIVQANRPSLVVADLLGAGTLGPNSQAITYFLEGAFEGAFTTVAEAGQKPQIHQVNPTAVTDPVRKIAAWWNVTDEMMEDLDFLVSEINARAAYKLAVFEEQQILSGGGTSTDLSGIMNRSIQSESSTSVADNPDALFRAMTKVQVNSGLAPDGIVINPTDYQELRLNKDSNGQYFGGGYFAGEYGNGGVVVQPPLWGMRTVVTSAISAGTVLVGAYRQAATLYRKGGVRIESTNSHASNFTLNLNTFRIEERVALAVRVPFGFCAVTLDDSSSS